METELVTVKVYDNNNKFSFCIEDSECHNLIIKWFVNQYNKIDSSPLNKEPVHSFQLLLIYHGFKDLFRNYEYKFWMDNIVENKHQKLPIIHLTWFDVFKENESIIEYDNSNNHLEEQWLLSSTPRYKKIMDSSIWNYYVPIFNSLKNDFIFSLNSILNNLHENLHETLVDINKNDCFGLYKLSIAHEYADLHARILVQSYLEGRHKAVSPFLFHSEGDMEKRISELNIKEKGGEVKVIDKVKEYQWRFLLVDDKCINRMSVESQKNDININKLEIIAHNLIHILNFRDESIWFRYLKFDRDRDGLIEKDKQNTPEIKFGKVIDNDFTVARQFPTDSDTLQIIIDCVESIDEAKKCLESYEYEIILLDYLLDNKTNREIEYGFQLLNDLQTWYKDSQNNSDNHNKGVYMVGPNKILSIMFISAFTTAVHERILEMGLERSERGLWHIGDSACPTNTPYLFSYLLLQLMRHRIRNLRKVTEGDQLTIIDLLEVIYVRKKQSIVQSVREEAYNHFNHLLFMRDKYKRLRDDLDVNDEEHLKKNPNDAKYLLMDMKSSLLVYSAFKVVHHFSEAFFDHLQHLVYLTAFGTIRQWQDMWEEYLFIHKELYDYDNYAVGGKKEIKDRGKIICKSIKEYIINLKYNCNE